jgi:hypothetical protein
MSEHARTGAWQPWKAPGLRRLIERARFPRVSRWGWCLMALLAAAWLFHSRPRSATRGYRFEPSAEAAVVSIRELPPPTRRSPVRAASAVSADRPESPSPAVASPGAQEPAVNSEAPPIRQAIPQPPASAAPSGSAAHPPRGHSRSSTRPAPFRIAMGRLGGRPVFFIIRNYHASWRGSLTHRHHRGKRHHGHGRHRK